MNQILEQGITIIPFLILTLSLVSRQKGLIIAMGAITSFSALSISISVETRIEQEEERLNRIAEYKKPLSQQKNPAQVTFIGKNNKRTVINLPTEKALCATDETLLIKSGEKQLQLINTKYVLTRINPHAELDLGKCLKPEITVDPKTFKIIKENIG